MKKITYLFSILLITVLFSSSLADKKNIKGPKIFLPEKEWDFGYIPQGSVVSHLFWIKNIGDDTLQIVKVRSGCACTHAPLKKDILAPQESTFLEVIFNSKNYQGLKTMGVAIFSNDTSTVSDVYFTANVENEMPLVQINPSQVKFDSLKIEENLRKKVVILNRSNTVLQLRVADKPKGTVNFVISKNVLNPKEKAEVSFHINQVAKPGSFQTNLTLDFIGDSASQVQKKVRCTLPISGTIASK